MKKAIILGASSGIGAELARLLVAYGYYVAITGRREVLLKNISASNPEKIIDSSFDVRDTKDLESKLEDLKNKLGGCDLFIISAGTGDINEDLNFETEKVIIDTNVSGFTCAADWAFRYFKQQGYGHLAGITSVAGMRGYRGAPAYNASKAYQISYLEGLRQKARKIKLPITVTDLRPGFVNTKMAKGEGQFWVSSPRKAASQIYGAIKRKKKVAYITKRWQLVGRLLRILPSSIYERM